MKSLYLTVFFSVLIGLLNGQDLIERNYFDNAKAKNAAIAAARYAEEGYYYTKFTTFINSVDSSRLFADTALFFIKRSLMLSDTSLYHAPKTNLRALNLLYEGKEKLVVADSVMREFYPMVEISSHRFFGKESSIHLSNAVMDLFNASLLLKSDAPKENKDIPNYEVLPFEDELVRLEADEASFQQAANSYEEEIALYEDMYKELENESVRATNASIVSSIETSMMQVEYQLNNAVSGLEDASFRIKEIRELLDKKYLQDVQGVEEPEYMSQFDKAEEGEVLMNEDVPDGLVYKIQLGYYPEDVDKNNFTGLFPVSGETVKDGLARFYAGLFFSYEEASRGNAFVRESAIPNSFVVPFYNGQKISMSRAVAIEQQRGAE
ncbi:hypothetical protein O3Q51_04995 [Cryomorphaceae bacterium 1068]|nr:hypothetical protein [Cryomorphaceae bacterium 1068]